MTALRSRNLYLLTRGGHGFTVENNNGCLSLTPVPGVKLEERFTAFAFCIFAFALSSPVS
jgi:hypothetical protein